MTKTVKLIPSELATPLIVNVHYAHRLPSIMFAYGLFIESELVGICTYGMPASPPLCKGIAGETNKDKVIELNRLCFLPGFNGDNNASVLVGRSLRLLPKGLFVVSYADFGAKGHIGYVYQATNWLYTGLSADRTDVFTENGKHPRHPGADTTKRQGRSRKHRYVYLTGNRKQQLAELRYEVLPYPKGDTMRYAVDEKRLDRVGSQQAIAEVLER